ncbi:MULTISPECIES: hypothetical protein [Mesorhizobium]|uniref:Uncharacterized protein n=2 Tax=Mesorhizobium ciceri TaxID=39645 RepID=E8TP92_MESCW|nr:MULTISPECIES: hypothetical protein [Mesorhizobium]RUY36054.1 hypothetical protein EN981_25820 [Mesorhizobium sp. M7A.F.Ca.CA.001.13.2.1]ADV15127.1 hypothetical protein Mesci_6129 [Mesorhizobium ciceri biovar biserrulae WSM1271]MBZ9887227.1 hypothetical protein [Mesorhizobium sp. BR1-1-3]MDF3217298.1 hypothetical protein [Mesorhizobium ciceri]RUY63413.1 hypothetical protein EN980_28060 [Mesorhizobium sp. M7A.F.Ca.CA.001.13.1.1]
MHDLIAFIQSNSALVAANPLAFATSAALFGAGGFAVGRYFLAERIANLESRIARRDEEITDLKAKQKAPDPEGPVPLFEMTEMLPPAPFNFNRLLVSGKTPSRLNSLLSQQKAPG